MSKSDDLISRQAAINAADRADYTGLAVEDVKKVTDEVVKELKQLPSAQPERKPMLYRDRVMLAKNFEEWARENHVIDCPEAVICYLDIIGLIQPERKTGWRIHVQYPYSKCSICGEELDTLSCEANYCPNCGARMEENDEAD